jgi:hypothetical protein
VSRTRKFYLDKRLEGPDIFVESSIDLAGLKPAVLQRKTNKKAGKKTELVGRAKQVHP